MIIKDSLKAQRIRSLLQERGKRTRDISLHYRVFDGRFVIESFAYKVKRLSEEFGIPPQSVIYGLGYHPS